jgi:hypothetical protein
MCYNFPITKGGVFMQNQEKSLLKGLRFALPASIVLWGIVFLIAKVLF